MKRLGAVAVLIAAVVLGVACGNLDAVSMIPGDADSDGAPALDGDSETDAEKDAEPIESERLCTGACATYSESTFCIHDGTALCLCTAESWLPYRCADLCAAEGKTSAGCGEVEGESMPFCQCEEIADGDEAEDVELIAERDPDTETVGPGELCAYGPVNADAGECGPGYTCFGVYADGSDSSSPLRCTSHRLCVQSWGEYGVCADGYCGMSFCTITDCAEDSECAPLGAGSCCMGVNNGPTVCWPFPYCGVITDGDVLGGPCKFQFNDTTILNPNVINCYSHEDACIGTYSGPDSGNPIACVTDADCLGAFGHLGTCANGYCGVAWCTRECAGIGDYTSCRDMTDATYGQSCCGQVGSAFACYIPEFCRQFGEAAAGEPCRSGAINADKDFCKDGLACLAQTFDLGSGPAACASDAECAVITGFDSDNLDCVNGFCAISWCAETCTEDASCATATYEMGCCESVASDGTKACLLKLFCE